MEPTSASESSTPLSVRSPSDWVPPPSSAQPHEAGTNISTVSKWQSALMARWNAAVPVNCLPNELFVEIFLLAMPRRIGHCEDTNRFSPDWDSWAPLMLVCRYWRNIVLSTPRLWRVIKIGKNLWWAELAVFRSQDAMLDITFWFNAPVIATVHPILLPVAERIAVLVFHGMCEHYLAPALRLVNSAHSNLVELRLTRAARGLESTQWRDTFPDGLSQSISICSQRFPAMTTLAIEGVRVSLKDPQAFISQLRVFEATRCLLLCDPPIFTLSTFLDILAGCGASLEEVSLHGMLSQFHDDLPARITGKLHTIPKLRRLKIKDKVEVVSSFMSSLHVPPTVAVRLFGKVESPSEGSPRGRGLFIPLLPPNRRQTLPALDGVRSLCLEVSMMGTEIELHASDSRDDEGVQVAIGMDVAEDGLPRAVDEVLQLFSHVPIASLTVSPNMVDDIAKAEWSRLFAGFGALESFTVISAGAVVPVFEVLAGSQPLPGEPEGSDRVVCPKLRELRVYGPWWSEGPTLESILECLKMRARGGAMRLEKLSLDLCFDSRKHFEDTKRIFFSKIGEVFDGETTFGYDDIGSDTDTEPDD